MLELGIIVAGLSAVSLTVCLMFFKSRRKSLKTRVNFKTYKAQELQKRGHYFNIVE